MGNITLLQSISRTNESWYSRMLGKHWYTVLIGILILFHSSMAFASINLVGVEFDQGNVVLHSHGEGAWWGNGGDSDYCGWIYGEIIYYTNDGDGNTQYTSDSITYCNRSKGTEIVKGYKLGGNPGCRLCSHTNSWDSGNICRTYPLDKLVLEVGKSESATSNTCSKSEECTWLLGQCGESSPLPDTTLTIERESSYTFKLVCQGSTIGTLLHIEAENVLIQNGTAPSGQDILINDFSPSYVSQWRAGATWWRGSLKWDIPINQTCGETVIVTPSFSNGQATAEIYLVKAFFEQCPVKISGFSGSSTTIDPSGGKNITFSGDIIESSGKTMTWTVIITDSSGAQWRKFSGSGQNPSIVWDGKDSFGKIVDDGLYTVTLEAETESGKCKKTASAKVTVKSSCRVSDISISPSWVSPQQTGGTDTKATISIALAAPAPSVGCTFKLGVEPIDFTGGHMHGGGRPTGRLSSDTVAILTKETGPKTVTYTSGEVGGSEKIIVALLDENGKVVSRRELTIDVKVPILGPLGDGGGWWRLTGQKDSHPDNHYAEPYTVQATPSIAIEYYQKTETTLGINDISLEWGGLFDIGPPNGVFWSTPHKSHRRGTGVDIDRSVYDHEDGEYIEFLCDDDKALKRIIAKYTAKLICEDGGKKHIQFY